MIHIFIVNPYAGKQTFAEDLRKKLAGIKNLNYFVFNTRYAGYEMELVQTIQKIFEDEQLRFYCCGGSGTMRNMMNGFTDLSKAEIAFYPCGLTNDFLKVFGDQEERFHHIEELIYGDVITVDYIESNHGVMLNTFSMGLDSTSQKKMEDYRLFRFFSENTPYIMSIFYALFFLKKNSCQIVMEGEYIEDKVTEVFFGNGNVLGGDFHFFPEVNAADGKGACRIIKETSVLQRLRCMWRILRQDWKHIDDMSHSSESSFIRIRRKDGEPFAINQDGELVHGIREWEAHIVNKGLHLVVPKGVKLT